MKLNRVITAIAIVVAICLFLVTNNAAALAFALVAIALPAVACIGAKICAPRVEISFRLQEAVVVGQDMSLEVMVSRPPLFRGRIELSFARRNVLVGTDEVLDVGLAPAMGNPERFTLPLSTKCCGHVSVELAQAQLVDAFGLVKVSLPEAAFQSSYTVYPDISDIEVQASHASRASISGASYDPRKRGQDSTEVFEMRDYREGDSMKSVHWKLSARFDELMVREASRPTDYDIVIIIDASPIDASDAKATIVLNATLAAAASISLALARVGFGHMVARSSGEDQLKTVYVDGRASFDEMLDALMTLPLSSEPMIDSIPFEMYRRSHNVTKAVFVTDRIDETLFSSIAALTDLSVFHISADDYSSLDEKGIYLLARIAADSIDERVKSLEL